MLFALALGMQLLAGTAASPSALASLTAPGGLGSISTGGFT